ncbi:unnamed protein product [Psylliodes chrysocephalus]|uniref:Prostaglandin reductase 1 n=1 Tax=Psylliodes chrysocephalus TaxID=3402493 RepID=A0A9P0G3Z1_9CUCU|nr:unnamed protein product [Psylliodes chrysocephala]CAH1101137.1 unnamed protein product [Psylliodes chrysocephala]
MVIAKVYKYLYKFRGFPKFSDLKLVEEELPEIENGEFLAEAVYLSVDPYMRAYAPNLPIGSTMIGSQVAKITESKNPDYPVGKYVVAHFGWRTHTISKGKEEGAVFQPLILPDFEGLPISYGIGILGLVGNTAYFGLLDICKPKEGETVVVSGAAGGVGSIVGQIAKIHGCKVIGIAGSDEKGKWLTEELGFDHFINYKTDDVEKALKAAAPNGVDCYFDNVGGDISSTVIYQMNHFGRISVCGSISSYNNINEAEDILIQFPLVFKQLRMEGFNVSRWAGDRYIEGIKQNLQWIKEGKLKCRETVTNGFENMFDAFTEMLKGKNVGKAVVKV